MIRAGPIALHFDNLSLLGVDYIKVGRTVQNIVIALSIYALSLRPTFEKLFTGVKVWHKVQKIGVRCKR